MKFSRLFQESQSRMGIDHVLNQRNQILGQYVRSWPLSARHNENKARRCIMTENRHPKKNIILHFIKKINKNNVHLLFPEFKELFAVTQTGRSQLSTAVHWHAPIHGKTTDFQNVCKVFFGRLLVWERIEGGLQTLVRLFRRNRQHRFAVRIEKSTKNSVNNNNTVVFSCCHTKEKNTYFGI